MSKYKHIMIQGTGSSVGKSLIVAGLCRYFSNKGLNVIPFKAQNMALNSGVTFDGYEIGRAQILQAEAARKNPVKEMNPILLKPTGKGLSQVIRLGIPYKTVKYDEYYKMYDENLSIVKDSFKKLEKQADFLIIEGAGSPAEINLQKTDIVNMKMADIANSEVFIVGDIDRGGIFASFKGTYELIEKKYLKYLKGFIINRFRGDIDLLNPGIKMFSKFCEIPIEGIIPFFTHNLEEEDSQGLTKKKKNNAKLKIGIIKLNYLSNFTDFTPFDNIEEIMIQYIEKPDEIDNVDVVIIPGSKDTISDAKFIIDSGFSDKLKSIYGKKFIIGICGGYQILGNNICENNEKVTGLSFINMDTFFKEEKVLERKNYKPVNELKKNISGYEIHHGISKLDDNRFQNILNENDVLIIDKKNKIIGTYLHGIFENTEFMNYFLKLLNSNIKISQNYFESKENQLNDLANILEKSLSKKILNREKSE